MNIRNLLLAVFIILTIAFASLTLSEYNQNGNLSGQLESRTHTIYTTYTTYVTTTQTTYTTYVTASVITYYYSPNVTIPVTCCPTMPTSFVVGSINGNLYGFNVTSGGGPYIIGTGPTVTMIMAGSNVAFKVYQPIPVAYQPNPPPLRIQWANFSFGATFSESVPHPSNATLFGGAVKIDWFVNSSLLYLHISTK